MIVCASTLAVAQKVTVGATVQTQSGPVTGHAALNRTAVSEYLGIPYASPPLGNLRFAAPQSYNSTKPFSASAYVCFTPGHNGQNSDADQSCVISLRM